MFAFFFALSSHFLGFCFDDSSVLDRIHEVFSAEPAALDPTYLVSWRKEAPIMRFWTLLVEITIFPEHFINITIRVLSNFVL